MPQPSPLRRMFSVLSRLPCFNASFNASFIASFIAFMVLAAKAPLAVAEGQSYDIPVSVRVVMAREQSDAKATAPKLTESETFRFLWHITTHPFGRVEVSHRGYRVPATLVTSASTGKALMLSMTNFLILAGLAMPLGEAEEHAAQLVQVPMWSYPAGVPFIASQSPSGYLSFYVVTGGEPPAN